MPEQQSKLSVADLALYLGQQCCIVTWDRDVMQMPEWFAPVGSIVLIDISTLASVAGKIATVSPLLRPLFSITKDEAKDLVIFLADTEVNHLLERILRTSVASRDAEHPVISAEDIMLMTGNPKLTVALLRLGFDIFGWIESGLAIDKTTLPAQ